MARDLNPTYRKMAYDSGPVKSKTLYDDLAKSMKEAFVTGKITNKAKNWKGRPQKRLAPQQFRSQGNRVAFKRFKNNNNGNNRAGVFSGRHTG